MVKRIARNKLLSNRKAHYTLIGVFLIIGMILVSSSVISDDKIVESSSMTCLGSHTIHHESNATVDFIANVDSYKSCHLNLYGDLTGSRDNTIFYMIYKSSNPSEKKVEGRIGLQDLSDVVQVRIPESGDWSIYLEYNEDTMSRVHVDLVHTFLEDKPLTEIPIFRAGVIFILYSVIAFMVSIYFTRVRKIRRKKGAVESNSKKH
jgi:hypothetical protein